MADGTFSLVPKDYSQLYIISAKIYNMWVPLLFVLMKNRSQNDYLEVWNKLLDIANEDSLDIPTTPLIFLDFEKASANTFQSVFPDGKILRCHFHLWQAVLRNLKKKHLYGKYMNNSDFAVRVKKVAALAFLRPEEVLPMFISLTEDAPDDETEFFQYFEHTFIRGKCVRRVERFNKHIYAKSKYPVDEWNVFHRLNDDLERTTNMQEACNRKLQACNFSGDHLTIFKLTSLLLDFNQRSTHNILSHITQGAPPIKRKKKDDTKHKNLQRLYQMYLNDEMGQEDYLFGCTGNLPLL